MANAMVFRSALMIAAHKALNAGKITRADLRRLRWHSLNDTKLQQIEKFSIEEIADDEDGIKIISAMIKDQDLANAKPEDLQQLFQWDWMAFIDIIIKILPLILMLL